MICSIFLVRFKYVNFDTCSKRYFYNVLRGVLSVTEKRGYSFHFETGFWEDIESNEFILRNVFSRSVDGAIIMPYYTNHYYFLDGLENSHFPYVVYNPMVGVNPTKSIVIDNYKGASKAAQYLIECMYFDTCP